MVIINGNISRLSMVVNLTNKKLQNNVTSFCAKRELYIDQKEQSHYTIFGCNVTSHNYSLNQHMFKITYVIN